MYRKKPEDYLDRLVLSTIRLSFCGAFAGVAMLLSGAFVSMCACVHPGSLEAILANIIMWTGGLLAIGESIFIVLYLCLFWPMAKGGILGDGHRYNR